MRILFIGDVIGGVGRRILRDHLPALKQQYQPDLTIVNGENLAGGLGATSKLLHEITTYGAQVITMGNHTWKRSELIKDIDTLDNVVRPANFPPGTPGKRTVIHEIGDGRRAAVFNLVGRIFMEKNDCPFRAGVEIARQLREQTPVVILDIHAEATSEKIAMGWYLDGKVSAVLGSHTHVQTADERILPNGTAFITDVGMTGPHDGVIGMKNRQVLTKFVIGVPSRYEVSDGDPQLHGVFVEVNDSTGRATGIERISLKFDQAV
ncbi:TIGR00282 family metallophosphoesterase [Candidatus Poribacteria bacterium]|nr:TIGR00282 family metallophosphoesterase [Candidatus Poribacteria bacterium]